MFFQKAYEGKNEWWMWLVTTFLAIVGYTLGQIPLAIAMFYYATKNGLLDELSEEELYDVMARVDLSTLGIDLNLGIFLILLMFVGMALFLIFFHRLFHKRSWKMLITPLEKINWGKIFFSFFLWLTFAIIQIGVSYYFDPEGFTLQFELGKFLPLLLIILILMPIQTTTEELLFRGYLMHGFGMWSGSKLTAAIVTSILFACMHMMNPEVKEFGFLIMMAYYSSVGFFLALITIMDDSLELAIGVHAATNMFSALLVSYDGGALQTNAIFNTSSVNVELMLPVFFVAATIYFIICWKKYKWQGWSKLLEPIQKPENIEPV